MSGDDGGFVALVEPTAPGNTADWSYSIRYLANSTGTIGSPALGDVDGDGVVEAFVPFYSEGRVEVYTMQGSPPPPPAGVCVACLLKKDPVGLSPDSEWCAVDGQCHLVGSPSNPCTSTQCSSAAKSSTCKCTSCNDAACGTNLTSHY